jgi:hypothetical protein
MDAQNERWIFQIKGNLMDELHIPVITIKRKKGNLYTTAEIYCGGNNWATDFWEGVCVHPEKVEETLSRLRKENPDYHVYADNWDEVNVDNWEEKEGQ